uniref:Uncharacterized protein n=1 Tax=Cucumis melo TaxID=3656 RepID=A0A9I9CVA6_CUCME
MAAGRSGNEFDYLSKLMQNDTTRYFAARRTEVVVVVAVAVAGLEFSLGTLLIFCSNCKRQEEV